MPDVLDVIQIGDVVVELIAEPDGASADREAAASLLTWTLRQRVINSHPFSFDGHEYLRAIYEDQARRIVLRKGSQVGASEFSLSKSMWLLDRAHLLERMQRNVIYFFPTDGAVREFSNGRITPAIKASPYLTRAFATPGSRSEQPDGTQHWRMMHGIQGLVARGMKTGVAVKSVPADMVVFDELDEASADAREEGEERLAHSDLRLIVELSTPTVPGFGIDSAWKESDQRYWFVDCGCKGGCSPDLSWPDCISWNGNEAYLRCPECRQRLDVNRGEWRPTAEHDTHGYQVSQLLYPRCDLTGIAKRFRDGVKLQRLHNHNLGIPYTSGDFPIPRDMTLACIRDDLRFEEGPSVGPYFAGVDVGELLHVAIGRLSGTTVEVTHLEAIEAPNAWERLFELLVLFGVHTFVVDAAPEGHTSKALVAQFPGRGYRATYDYGSVEVRWNRETQKVNLHRTDSLDALRERLIRQMIHLPGGVTAGGAPRMPVVEAVVQHCAALTRDIVDTAQGQQVARYGRQGPDHYAHSLNYMLAAADRQGMEVEEIVTFEDVIPGGDEFPMIGAARL